MKVIGKPHEAEAKIIYRKLMRWRVILIYLAVGLFLTILFAISVGPVYIHPAEVFNVIAHGMGFDAALPESHVKIVLQVRLPRVVLGVFVGAALSVAGVIVQGLFRNPLADPYVLGVSSGASLGAALSLTLLPAFLGVHTTPFTAFIGGLIAMLLVYNIVKFCGRFTATSLLLAGIATAYLFSAILSMIIWLTSKDSHRILMWVLGGLWGAGWLKIQIVSPIIMICALTAFAFSRDLNALSLGEEFAQSLGVNVSFLKKFLPILASLITSAAVSFSGAIGFIGLMIPHIMRLLVGPDHRILLPSSALGGGIFLVLADTLARCLMELPVGVITALAGTPFFIYLMRRRELF